MKKLLLLLILINYDDVYSQKINQNFFQFSNHLGFSEFEVENNFKVNALNYTVYLGKEFSFEKSAVIINVSYGNYFYDYNNLHDKSSFIDIPIGYRLYVSRNNPSSFYSGLGINNKIMVNNEIYNSSQNSTIKGDKGYNMGSYAEFGFNTEISSNLKFFIGLNYYSDLLQSGYTNKTKINNQINLTLGLNVFKKQ